jgi:hypothetical protein
MNMWEEHAKREARLAKLKKFDERLQRFHNEHPFLELLLIAVLSLAVLFVAMGVKALIEWIASL